MSPMYPIFIYLIQFIFVVETFPNWVSLYPRPEFNYTYDQIGTLSKDQDEKKPLEESKEPSISKALL